MIKKILVIGSNGQLGKSIQDIASQYMHLSFVFTDRNVLDITNNKKIQEFFKDNLFDAVLNCAAYTAVDKAETDIENARLVNAIAVKYLAQETAKQNIPFFHISTDYVFDGTKAIPRLENDNVNPIGIYGQTKLEGENFALTINSKTCIIRTSWVYSKHGNNFVKTMLRLFNEKAEIGVINDQIGSPTYALDLAHAILNILSKKNIVYGIFNYSNEGACTWYDFATKIKEITHANCIINPIPTAAYPTPAKRPAFSLLDKTKIKETYQIKIPCWESSLLKMFSAN